MPLEVEVIPPSGVEVTATISVALLDPEGFLSRWFELAAGEGELYTAGELLQLPLEPMPGEWRLLTDVRSLLSDPHPQDAVHRTLCVQGHLRVKVEGPQEVVFRPAPVLFRDLAGILPDGVEMRIPQDFGEVMAQGDQWAGGRAWRYGGGELALWWAPGPTEPLLLNNALVMLEATHDPGSPPHVLRVEEITWQDHKAFLFYEEWPGDPKDLSNPLGSKALVVAEADYWLYVLRVRATSDAYGGAIPPLLDHVWKTFSLTGDYPKDAARMNGVELGTSHRKIRLSPPGRETQQVPTGRSSL